MPTSDLANYLALQFMVTGYKWQIGGKKVTPSVDDIQKTLDKAKSELYDRPVPSQLEIGRLIIQHDESGKFTVYMYQGEY